MNENKMGGNGEVNITNIIIYVFHSLYVKDRV